MRILNCGATNRHFAFERRTKKRRQADGFPRRVTMVHYRRFPKPRASTRSYCAKALRLTKVAYLASLVVGVALGPSAASAQSGVALLIGNKNYKGGVGKLVNTHNDVERLAKTLTNLNFEVMKRTEVKKDQFAIIIDEYIEKLQSGDSQRVGFFYYSGHGIALSEAGPNFLLPVDIRGTQYRDITAGGVNLQEEVLNKLTHALGGKVLNFVIFDACRNSLELTGEVVKGNPVRKGFTPIRDEPRYLLAFSTAPNRSAFDVSGQSGVGPYADALAKRLEAAGANHAQVFAEVRYDVVDATAKKQVPWVRDGLLQPVYFSAPPSKTSSDPACNCAESPSEPAVQAPQRLAEVQWVPTDYRRIKFKKRTYTYDAARGDSDEIEEMDRGEVHFPRPGTKILAGKVDDTTQWFRYVPDVGSDQPRYVDADEVDAR